MKKTTFLKSLLVTAGLCVGASAWATVYNGTTANYEVLFGSPVFTDGVITDVTPATEFTSDNSEQNYTTMSLQISGSCLAGNQANGRTYSFTNAPTTGKVYFKANGYFVGGAYNFFSILGSVTDSEGTENETYKNIVQSPYNLPSGSGETTVLRIFGQNITASYVYTPRTVVYGFDVTIDLVNQKVDYTVTYASKGSSGTVTAVSTATGSVAVPDGYTLNSVSSWSLPRINSSGANYYDNVAFYSKVPTATLYSATFTETNGLTPTITIYSNSEMTEEVANGYLTDGTTYYYKATLTGYDDKTGSFTVSGAAPSVSFTMEATPVYSYTVNAVDGSGNILKQLASGSDYKGTTIYYYYNNVLNVNGTLYTAVADNSAYKSHFTLDSDSKVVTKVYSQPATVITNLVFLAEGEDLFTRGTGSTADTRCSMGAGGYAGNKTAFVTLPAGTYYLVLLNRCSGDRTGIHKFYQGDAVEAFWSADGNGYNATRESGEFTLSSTTTLYMQGGDNNQYVDWLYIYGTPTNEIVGALDYSKDYLEDMTEKVTLTPGQSYHYMFVNHNMGSTAGWAQNWVLPVYASDGTTKKIVVRADNWEDIGWKNDGFSWTTSSGAWTDEFLTEMDGAIVDMTVSYNAENVFTMSSNITTSTGRTLTYSYNSTNGGITLTDESIKVALSVSMSWLELLYEGSTGTVSKTISAAGWATYCSPYALDLANATGLTDAYIVTGGASGVLTKVSVKNGTIPANTGLLLKGAQGTVTIPVVASYSTDVTANKFVGVTAETVIDAETGYVLMDDETNGLGFYKNENAFTVGANTAYLPDGFDGSNARIAFFSFGDDATSISSVESADMQNAQYYNLNGQRTLAPQKGLYIVNGKKVVLK